MSFFSVTPEEVVAGSSVIGTGGAQGSRGFSAVSGAAAATPVQSAWGVFIDRAASATLALDDAATELAQAMVAAANAYTRADSTGAVSLAVHK